MRLLSFLLMMGLALPVFSGDMLLPGEYQQCESCHLNWVDFNWVSGNAAEFVGDGVSICVITQSRFIPTQSLG